MALVSVMLNVCVRRDLDYPFWGFPVPEIKNVNRKR